MEGVNPTALPGRPVGLSHVLQHGVGRVGGASDRLLQLLGVPGLCGIGLDLGAQVVLQRVGVADDLVDQLVAIGARLDEGEGLSGQGARGVDERSPHLPSLPPAVVAGVVAKAEEDGEGQSDEGERNGGQRVCRESPGLIVPGHEGGGCGHQQQSRPDLGNGASAKVQRIGGALGVANEHGNPG